MGPSVVADSSCLIGLDNIDHLDLLIQVFPEAIALAVTRGLPVVLDDLAARRTAQEMDVRVVGTLGVILRAKRRGFIPACKPLIDGLLETDFRISETLYQRVLQLADE